jgi:phosphoribosyl-AMP cyclohydrolase
VGNNNPKVKQLVCATVKYFNPKPGNIWMKGAMITKAGILQKVEELNDSCHHRANHAGRIKNLSRLSY